MSSPQLTLEQLVQPLQTWQFFLFAEVIRCKSQDQPWDHFFRAAAACLSEYCCSIAPQQLANIKTVVESSQFSYLLKSSHDVVVRSLLGQHSLHCVAPCVSSCIVCDSTDLADVECGHKPFFYSLHHAGQQGRAYSKRCKRCKTTFFPNYYQLPDKGRCVPYDAQHAHPRWFMVSRETVIDVALLDQFDAQLMRMHAAFQEAVDVHNYVQNRTSRIARPVSTRDRAVTHAHAACCASMLCTLACSRAGARRCQQRASSGMRVNDLGAAGAHACVHAAHTQGMPRACSFVRTHTRLQAYARAHPRPRLPHTRRPHYGRA